MTDETVTSEQLRAAATSALELDEFLEKCSRNRVLCLMGFDLDWLAEQFTKTADRLDHGE